MIAFDYNTKSIGQRFWTAFYGRRDGKRFKYDDYEIMSRYGHKLVMWGRIPEALSGAMANQMYVGNFDTEEEMFAFYADIAATYEE